MHKSSRNFVILLLYELYNIIIIYCPKESFIKDAKNKKNYRKVPLKINSLELSTLQRVI